MKFLKSCPTYEKHPLPDSLFQLTVDYKKINNRKRDVSLEELFYFSYIKLSKYVDPTEGKRCNLEYLLDKFVEYKKNHDI